MDRAGDHAASYSLARGRAAFEAGGWSEAYAVLLELEVAGLLEAQDLERLAVAAYLTGRGDAAVWWEKAHDEWLIRADRIRAARCAAWLAIALLINGRVGLGQGWLARATSLTDEAGEDCAERTYPTVAEALGRISAGDNAGALALAEAVVEVGERLADGDLAALGRHISARALIRLGRPAEGVALFDELMIVVSGTKLSPIAAGLVFCSAIEGCQEAADVRRAQEWTAALTRWCAAHPGLVPFQGECLVHQAELLMLHGAWTEADQELDRCLATFADTPAIATAWHLRGELHRLRGEFAQAESAYRQTSRLGEEPQPGWSLLRLEQGQTAPAAAAIQRALDEVADRSRRGTLLGPYVQIMLAGGDLAAAQAGADELRALAQELQTPWAHALAAQAVGAVWLAQENGREALAALRRAWREWRDLDATYAAGQVRVQIAKACRMLGDEDGAQLELDAAAWVFTQLGAGPDQRHVDALLRPAARGGGLLSPREGQVLRLVAGGRTNRAIATELFLSEKTVARHVGNIFAKLGVRSRSAATAYAYEHGLLQ